MDRVKQLTSSQVDHFLAISLSAWRELTEVANEYDSWRWDERVDFVEEWALQEMYLKWLKDCATRGALNEKQASRYNELSRIVADNRPIIEDLNSR